MLMNDKEEWSVNYIYQAGSGSKGSVQEIDSQEMIGLKEKVGFSCLWSWEEAVGKESSQYE